MKVKLWSTPAAGFSYAVHLRSASPPSFTFRMTRPRSSDGVAAHTDFVFGGDQAVGGIPAHQAVLQLCDLLLETNTMPIGVGCYYNVAVFDTLGNDNLHHHASHHASHVVLRLGWGLRLETALARFRAFVAILPSVYSVRRCTEADAHVRDELDDAGRHEDAEDTDSSSSSEEESSAASDDEEHDEDDADADDARK